MPKVVATSRDGRYVLVSNWCGYDLSVISTKLRPAGARASRSGPTRAGSRSPQTKDVAYVAEMGGSEIVARQPRDWSHAAASPSGPARGRSPSARPAATCSSPSTRRAGSRRLDLRTGAVAKVSTGTAPRSLAMAPDGRSLYVVNYESGTVSKVRASDMRVLQSVDACYHPIGITYEPVTRRVWVACYGGAIKVYDDR